ncbi:pilus assembly protein [Alphaproteobacteria bacterium GH1-50]|uniref:Pilus assembly protein n=1 Tax=Kangsaoukella pontilimi TaxID=2691042 RepID=A0A7C9IRH8_9RHOB|nr:TadE/TadG family type IV pilus assembly protein [Kangsaoukella pontilimi]MXQ07526.1 pilus assembly protein [Kangsaoukella pontilimi]
MKQYLVHKDMCRPRGFLRREDGTTMVEFAICISLFLLILFAILDFARLGYTWVSAEKAVQQAARTASLRPAVCDGVPPFHFRSLGTPDQYPAGTLCWDGTQGVCEVPSPVPQCTLQSALTSGDQVRQDAAQNIWDRMAPLLPDNLSAANVRITYGHDNRLGFVGGPYVPVITAELIGVGDNNCNGNPCFTFVTPLSALAANAGAADTSGVPAKGGTIPFPGISATVPGEDINSGMNG